MRLLGITHTVVGELLAEKWSLPKDIRLSIRHHTNGFVNEDYNPLVAAIHIANVASSVFGLGYKWEHVIPKPNIEIWKHINLPTNFFEQSIQKIYYDYEESTKLLLKN